MDISTRFKGTKSQALFTQYVEEFTSKFGTHKKSSLIITGIAGRILRGKTDTDFLSLTDNPQRKIIFLTSGELLTDFIGQNGREILGSIGYTEEFINSLLSNATQFKLILFPTYEIQQAKWDNLLTLTRHAYPEWKEKIERTGERLKNLSYQEAINASGEVSEVRRFLEQTINVSELYTGDGYIMNEQHTNTRNYPEYISLNKQLEEFEDYCLISFPVE